MIVVRISYNPNASTRALRHVRPGGIIAAHNAFGGGKVLAAERDGDIEAVRQATGHLACEPRLLSTDFLAGDGMVIGVVLGWVKRPTYRGCRLWRTC